MNAAEPPQHAPLAGLSKQALRRQQLDDHTRQVQDIILSRQDPNSGLLPASTAVTVHGDYTHAWVRDNVYSILAVWALGLAYRRVDPSEAVPLEGAVIRLMRGLLAAMMRQSHKVERFKHTQSPMDALHAKYDTARGEPVVGDGEWGHLQIDATAIFVLILAQMSRGGLKIIQHPAEVAFVQNLVYYLAKAWCTPDYGIWERGNKRNDGKAELNASSVGMAKAALEAIDGFEPLPGKAPAVLVPADDIAYARSTLQALLPRESESKETDAALLSIIGFPAFAIGDMDLVERTRQTVLDKLEGHYGCKRFLRDGHQTVLEDHNRLHYEPGELERFAHIESEWPLFFTYLLIDASLRDAPEEAAGWRDRLDALMVERNGQRLLPELYWVPEDAVAAERTQPRSQSRQPNDNVPLVWAQSLFIVGALLQEGHISAADLDPMDRRKAVQRPETVVLVCPLAEDALVHARLSAQGVPSQALATVQTVQVRSTEDLKGLLGQLGRWDAQGLTGRPHQSLGSLTTGQLFTRGEDISLCLPAQGPHQGFYLALDNRLAIKKVAIEIEHLRRHWRRSGQPLLPLLVTQSMLNAPGANTYMAYLKSLSEGGVAQVRTGALDRLMPQAAQRRILGAPPWPLHSAPSHPNAWADATLNWEEAATRSLTAERLSALSSVHDDTQLKQQLERSRNPYEQIELLMVLWRRCGPEAVVAQGHSVRVLTEAIYARACRRSLWGVIRRAAGLLDLHDTGLEEAVAEIVVRGKRVALGRSYSAGSVVSHPLENHELQARLHAHGGDDPRTRVLIEEIVVLLGLLSKADPDLFAGVLTLRPWQSVLLLTAWLAREHGLSQAEAMSHLLELSPHAILVRLREVFARQAEMAANLVSQQSLHAAGGQPLLLEGRFAADTDPTLLPEHGGWLGWREMTGAISRVPKGFHRRTWALLEHCAGLVIGDQLNMSHRIDSRLARADTTAGERSFALQLDELLNRIQAPEYRQLNIEALTTLSEVLQAHPGLRFDEPLVLDVLIGVAVRIGWEQGGVNGTYSEQVPLAWKALYESPPHRVANLIIEALQFLANANRKAGPPASG